MTRDHKLSTTLTEDEKTAFRVLAAERNMNMSEYLREIVYDEMEAQGKETSRDSAEEDESGNPETSVAAD